MVPLLMKTLSEHLGLLAAKQLMLRSFLCDLACDAHNPPL